MVEPVGAQGLQLSQALLPQDLLHRETPLSHARRASRTHGVTRRGDEGAGDAGGDPDHVIQDAAVHRVDLVVDVEAA